MPLARPIKTLVIDDCQEFAEMAQWLLGQLGCDAGAATTPYAGLAQAGSVRYDLILIDYHMPGLNGLEVLRQLRNRGHRYLFLITGGTSEITVQDALDAGADGILLKPLDVSRLLGLVQYIASQSEDHTETLPPELWRVERWAVSLRWEWCG